MGALLQPEEPMYLILKAQAANIARIQTDLVLPGTTGTGDQVKLWGPTPELVRLYDTPVRFVQADVLENWERIVTLAPIADVPTERFAARTDRSFQYMIHFLIRLLDSEIDADTQEVVTDGLKATNPLALKAHRFIFDFHHVFFDDQHLETVECTQGLVDDADYELRWDSNIEYPMALFTARVTGTRSAW